MNKNNYCDVIIIARGGGSLEDLWPFNEEILARAIYESKIPIISAVGHETDFTISDFVADLRAPTPSAAAELAVPDVQELRQKINTYQNRMKTTLKKKIELMKLKYEKIINSKVFKEPLFRINEYGMWLDRCSKSMFNSINLKIKDEKLRFGKIAAKLDALSPLKTLERGYCIAQVDNKAIKSVNDVNKDEIIDLCFTDGTKKAKIE